MNKYILDGRNPVACNDLFKWCAWMQTAERHVAKTEKDGVKVSTVFLGLDHSFNEGEEPTLFETMIFRGNHDGHQTRCSTWEAAEAMHKTACEFAFGEKS